MIDIVTAVSKYLFILMGALFALNGFLGHIFYARKRKEGRIRQGILQRVMVISLSVCGNIVLFINKQDFLFIVFLFMELFYLFFLLNVFPIIYVKCNRILLNDIGFLMCVGMLMLSRLDTDKMVKQYILIFAGTIFLLILPVIVEKLHFLIKLNYLYCFAGIGLLAYVLIRGSLVYGANLSISIGSFSFQPSEFVKLSFIIFVASMLYKNTSLGRIFVTSVLAAVHVLILVASNDLGAGLIFYVTYVVMLYDATHKKRYLAMGFACAVFAGLLAFFFVSHVKVRVTIWQDPFKFIDGKGYQLVQAIYAIGNGGWFGTGLTRGLPGSIPVVTKDFIFPAISEEFGGLFGILVILVCLNLFLEIITILSESDDKFNRLMLGGFGIMYVFQCFLHIGGSINCIPCTGVTLPFVSYGGSSIISSMMMIAVVEGIAIDNNKRADGELPVNMRSPRMVFGSFMLVLILIVYYSYTLVTFDKGILDSTYNRRLSKLSESTHRGSIFASSGEELAYTQADGKRMYTYGRIFSHVIGYTMGEGAGLEGLLSYRLLTSDDSFERKLECELSGQKYAGNNVVTTLDYDMQMAAYLAMEDFEGAAVVMDMSGAVLAMVSKPDFNPNTVAQGLDPNADSPLLNRAVAGLYPPGSTFKPVTLLAYMRSSGSGFSEFVYECNGAYMIGDSSISCVGHTSHGHVDSMSAMAKSCNGAFITMGLAMQDDIFRETAEKLGFNEPVVCHDGLGLVAVDSKFDVDEESAWNVAQTSFGQGNTLITPMFNALIMQAVANKGIMSEPYMVKSIVSASGKQVYSYDGLASGKEVMTEDESSILRSHLEGVVTEGFPHVFSDCPYTAAGKSGTAQYGTQGYEHSLFVGYMPADNPQIIVSVVLEGFNEKGQPGKYAVNVVKEIFDAWYEKGMVD